MTSDMTFKSMNILIVIPARGGSKGIPRKNLRSLVGAPLISYSIKTGLQSKYRPDVYVSSDDDEILSVAAKLGAKIHLRDSSIAQDATTLDPVIYDAYQYAQSKENKIYDIVVTLQPTSPLLKRKTLDDAIAALLHDPSLETVIAARDDTHLTWRKEGDRFVPNYQKRLNRQFLTPTFREAGSFLITRSSIMSENNRIGTNVHLVLLSGGEAIDIDTFEDWNLCEYFIKRKKVLFVVSGYSEIGLGHVYNTLILANDMLGHDVHFLVDKKSDLAFDKISSHNYQVQQQQCDSLIDDIIQISPDLIINDLLDTSEQYIQQLKKSGFKVINFEDLGEGTQHADIVINAIYPESHTLPNHYYGPDYFVLRDEFVLTPQKVIDEKVTSVLLTFGGVDPANLTLKVLKSIYSYCLENEIAIHVVAGFGYDQYESLAEFSNIHLHRNTKCISDHMIAADLIFTSAGRTVYEVASLGVPAIVMAQNSREMTHFFANENHGFLNLGLGSEVNEEIIYEHFKHLCNDSALRHLMSCKMKQIDLRGGRQRVQQLIRSLMEE